MAWICAIRRKEGGKGEERLYFREDEKRQPTDITTQQFLQRLFNVQRATSISLRHVETTELPRLMPLAHICGVQIHYEAML